MYRCLSFVMLLFVFTSCGNKEHSTKAEAGGHGHEEEKVQFTAYSNDYELFAEADPLVAGQESNILSHFTRLSDFKAVDSSTITLTLVVNNHKVSQVQHLARTRGIYNFTLKPSHAGPGQLIYDISNATGTARLIVDNITVYDKEEEADAAAVNNTVSRVNTIVFTKEQSWKIDFSTALPVVESFGQVIRTTAVIESAANDESVIASATRGMVMLSGKALSEGSPVTAGQSLFTISGTGLSDDNLGVRLMQAQSNYEKASSDYDRKKALAKDKIISEKDLQASRAEFEHTEALYNLLNKNFRSGGQSVCSPVNGYIKQLLVHNGQYVEAGQAVLSVTQNKTLTLVAEVRQKFAPVLPSLSTAVIKTLHNNRTYTLQDLNGKILSYGRSANEDNHLIPVTFQIDNKGDFVAGSVAEIYLKTLDDEKALTIPNTALLEEQGNFFVLVQITPELFEKREVKAGSSDGIRTTILTGLKADERIVTTGAVMVKLAQASGTLDAHSGHVH